MKLFKHVNVKFVGIIALLITTSAACTEANDSKGAATTINEAKAATVESQESNIDQDDFATTLGGKLNLDIESIADAPVDGLLQLNTDKGIFYASEDGNYFLQARIYNVTDGIVDETENALKGIRLSGIEAFSESAIVFKAADEKYVIDVFTDTTCGYCRKLHNEMTQYNNLGITVRYLAFPRAGLNSENYVNTVSVWCAEDPNEAMNQAKAGGEIASASCDNDVAEQFQFGQRIGVTGTPNIVMPDGSVVPGYQPAAALAAALADAAS
ncbi:MAG: bifunctional protein-disulfide isomerase/oxidoreductase DsbC [Pseudomonadota bacterium]